MPNQPGQVQNYQFITSVPQNSDNLSLRMGRAITDADRLSVSYNIRMQDSETAQLFGYRDTTDSRAQSASLGWTRNIKANVINNLRLSFSRNRVEMLPFFAFGADVAGELGIEGTSDSPINFGPPNLTFTNFGNLTDGSPLLRRNQTLGISEGVTWVKGNHNLSIGGDYRWMQINTISEQNARGSFTFSGLATSAFNAEGLPLANTGFDFADFVLGLPQSSSIRFGNPDTYFRAPASSLYVQDDWRVRANFTVNFGLRYEYLRPFQEKYDRIANLDIAPGFTGVDPVLPGESGAFSGVFPDALIRSDRNNIAPRFGIAWKPFPQRSTLGARGLWLVLQRLGLQQRREPVGAAAAVRHDGDADDVAGPGLDASERVLDVAGSRHHEYLCRRPQLSRRLCADVELRGAAGSAGIDGSRSRLSRNERNAARHPAFTQSGAARVAAHRGGATADRKRGWVHV